MLIVMSASIAFINGPLSLIWNSVYN
jgi:hypothetical protein